LFSNIRQRAEQDFSMLTTGNSVPLPGVLVCCLKFTTCNIGLIAFYVVTNNIQFMWCREAEEQLRCRTDDQEVAGITVACVRSDSARTHRVSATKRIIHCDP